MYNLHFVTVGLISHRGSERVWGYLSVFENSLGPVEKQKTNVTVSQAEVTLQDLQHIDARSHGQGRVAAERSQPSQEVIRSHGAVTEGRGWRQTAVNRRER